MTRITVAGELILDIVPEFECQTVERLEQVLVPGRATLMGKCNIYPGAVSNTALALKKLGANVKLIGRIGKDDYGMLYRQKVIEQMLDAELIEDETASTPYSICLAIPGMDRMFLYNPGAANCFRAADVKDEELEQSQVFHLAYPTAMHYMFIEGGKECASLLRRAKEKGAVTSMDICFIDEQEEGPHQNWEIILKNCCPYLDIFAPSIEELMYYLEREKYKMLISRANGGDYLDVLTLENDIIPLADKLLAWGCRAVLIKCGKRGMYLKTAESEKLADMMSKLGSDANHWGNVSHMEAAYHVEKVLSASGAGDTAIAAFLMSAALGYDWKRCLEISTAAGARCVMSYDSYSEFVGIEELEKIIDAGWQKAKI